MALAAPPSWMGTEQASGIPRTLLTTTKHQLLFFKVKNNSFSLNTTEHLRHAAKRQMMKVTVDASGMQYKMCVVTKKRSFSRQLPRLTPFYLLFREPAQQLWDSCLDPHIFCSNHSSVVVFH